MIDKNLNSFKYDELMSRYQSHVDTYNALYRLKTNNEEDLKEIFHKIKTNLIALHNCSPTDIISDISAMSRYNNRCMKSYIQLVKLIYDEYKPTEKITTVFPFDYLFYKEYGIFFDKDTKDFLEDFESQNLILNIHEENTVYRAIMDDDIGLLISFTNIDDFDKNQTLNNELYPDTEEEFSLLELCCYYGSVNCFKLLISKFKSEITARCLRLSFLGGNPEIISECLKYQKPDEKCMEFAIISRNIDFVSFLKNEYNIEIDPFCCSDCINLQAFFIYLDQTNDIKDCFVYSPKFHMTSLCEYFISRGVDINAQNEEGKTVLYYASSEERGEMVEFLISKGADINAKDKNDENPLHGAAYMDNIDAAKSLISHGANINETDNDGATPLDQANYGCCEEMIEFLNSLGAC
ncbi:hypothetical protein TVAG_432020 [Trichomonas vaginalis G3]|uniref:DUF3447 domain-containing protein n=1 Tax=Trichomonas vaginalis (strain ATCC PRA-98 / G3) TaxID=412133 RepID=A2F7Z9_TRIV3|nr:proteasome regulatory particle assembly [Trichomonas vaginalis G3]EAX98993.1 hypothetical protein TVAG_432020 [Trichomonas vaginalis G3]KAI5507251.1 proteasome regulatory particle assembly [Trichomonas vaginalis G3]|eukprot:XP_001311923.1 hypothetical protein [Trichomonas vaginalis G3]